MTITRPIVSLDLETTGTDVVKDRIVELGVVVLHPDGRKTQWVQRFNPEMPIPAEASAVHGIFDADVAGAPKFAQYAAGIYNSLRGKDLCGYNLRRFDLPMLDESLRRCGLRLDLADVNVFDAFGIFCVKEPRTLAGAVRKYLGRDHEDAHGALADAEASLNVLMAQIESYEDLKAMEPQAVAELSRNSDVDYADLAGKLYRDSDGDLRYAFGKCKDVKVKHDPGFGQWMIRQGTFPASTCEVLREALGVR